MSDRKFLIDVEVPGTMPDNWNGVVVLLPPPLEEDLEAGKLLSGNMGSIFRKLAHSAGIDMQRTYFMASCPLKAPANNVDHLFVSIGKYMNDLKEGRRGESKFPMFNRTYMATRYEAPVAGVVERLKALKPKVIVAMGPLALWLVTGETKINMFRGVASMSEYGPVVPTYAHTAMNGQWDMRPVVHADLVKAVRVAKHGLVRPKRAIWVRPTLGEVEKFFAEYLKPLAGTGQAIAVDIETVPEKRLITCVGFAPDPWRAISVPLVGSDVDDYWERAEDEARVVQLMAEVLEDARYVKLLHNAAYDIIWLSEVMGLKVRGVVEDTMHMYHSMQPELRKGLGVLGSIYTDEGSWKSMVSFKSNKAEA